MKKILFLTLISALALSACKPPAPDAGRKEKALRFIVNHPIAAYKIGMKADRARNITTNSVRFSIRLGLDDTFNPNGRGTQVNAVRHTLWQATIASQFSAELAKEAGDAYEKDNTPPDPNKTEFNKLYDADESVDLRNNAIGRSIGEAHKGAEMKTLVRAILDRYHQEGLWQIFPVEQEGKTVYQIRLTKLGEEDYQKALAELAQLNQYGAK
ncbi:DUF6973 domain-containing protein [Neisseria wadsworthii]|uniref:DUF6973 domain-containing protein n=1 Tax=Neisseria wadsworthii 9715 TaxID=1030841 RepID=G4CR59_9NEIS|nr:hypothetical protein [Neisseria wadsworthii]EGZ45472.1 hypothetical protein HMPREF9370_1569 [Neisseria wadsworthii 9715]QMT35273.1 hypothetical protein H3L96_09505 [Neisseria wadsworthii]